MSPRAGTSSARFGTTTALAGRSGGDGTVTGTASSVFEELQVGSRAEAVQRARQEGRPAADRPPMG